MDKLVTKSSMVEMIEKADAVKKMHIVGRALTAIYNNQTQDEKSSEQTIDHNGIGFTGPDADWGSRSAKIYIRDGKLSEGIVNTWLKPAKGAGGAPKITKYWKQLNVVANIKKERARINQVSMGRIDGLR